MYDVVAFGVCMWTESDESSSGDDDNNIKMIK